MSGSITDEPSFRAGETDKHTLGMEEISPWQIKTPQDDTFQNKLHA